MAGSDEGQGQELGFETHSYCVLAVGSLGKVLHLLSQVFYVCTARCVEQGLPE